MCSFPYSGVYGANEYNIALPLAIITLPEEDIVNRAPLFSALPPEVQHVLDKMVGAGYMHTHTYMHVCVCVWGVGLYVHKYHRMADM